MTENIKHNIIIDDNINVTLSIPQTLTAMELNGLMIKTKKLMNVSEVSLESREKISSKPYYRWNPTLQKSFIQAMNTRPKDGMLSEDIKKWCQEHKQDFRSSQGKYYHYKDRGLIKW